MDKGMYVEYFMVRLKDMFEGLEFIFMGRFYHIF